MAVTQQVDGWGGQSAGRVRKQAGGWRQRERWGGGWGGAQDAGAELRRTTSGRHRRAARCAHPRSLLPACSPMRTPCSRSLPPLRPPTHLVGNVPGLLLVVRDDDGGHAHPPHNVAQAVPALAWGRGHGRRCEDLERKPQKAGEQPAAAASGQHPAARALAAASRRSAPVPIPRIPCCPARKAVHRTLAWLGSPQALAHNRVQCAKRLVQQHEARVAGQRARHRHALPLSARQLRRVAAAQALQPRQLQQLLHAAGR